MDVTTRRSIERQIVSKFIVVALAAGYSLSLDNGGDDLEFENSTDHDYVLGEMFATDEDRLFLTGEKKGWVQFIYGNGGWDVVADYTTNLEGLMPEVNELSDRLCDQYE